MPSGLTRAKAFLGLALLVVLTLSSLPGTASATSGQSVNVSADLQGSSDSHAAISGSHVYVVWTTTESSGSTQVLFRASSNYGATWGPVLNISNDAGPANYGRVDASGSNVFVFWTDKSAGNSEVYFAVSNDCGATWAAPADLSNSATPSRHFRTLTVGSDIYVAWVEKLSGNNEVQFTSSQDSGAHWSAVQDLSSDVNDSVNIGIAKVSNSIFVTWMALTPHFQILLRGSNDGGSNWNPVINVSNDAGNATLPDIWAQWSLAGGDVYVVWQDTTSGTSQIMFRVSHDAGATWSSSVNLSHDSGKSSNAKVSGQVLGDLDYVYVAWTDSTPGNNDIFFASSSNGGLTFHGTADLSANTGSSSTPRIMVMAHSVLVVWVDYSGGTQDVMLRTSMNFGASFGLAVNLSSNSASSTAASFNDPVQGSGSSYVVWTNNTSGNGDIYLQRLPATADTLFPFQLPQHVSGGIKLI